MYGVREVGVDNNIQERKSLPTRQVFVKTTTVQRAHTALFVSARTRRGTRARPFSYFITAGMQVVYIGCTALSGNDVHDRIIIIPVLYRMMYTIPTYP